MKTNETTATPERAEWLRMDKAASISGLSRSLLYELIAEGAIKSACIRRRNAQRGTRLVSADSLAAFIESCVDTREGKEVAS